MHLFHNVTQWSVLSMWISWCSPSVAWILSMTVLMSFFVPSCLDYFIIIFHICLLIAIINNIMSIADASKNMQVPATAQCVFHLKGQHCDCWPWLLPNDFNYDSLGCLTFVSKLDTPKQHIQYHMSAMERFQNIIKRARTEDCNTALEILHKNSITQVSIYEVNKQDCHQFCTTGIDGAMTIWDFKTLESST